MPLEQARARQARRRGAPSRPARGRPRSRSPRRRSRERSRSPRPLTAAHSTAARHAAFARRFTTARTGHAVGWRRDDGQTTPPEAQRTARVPLAVIAREWTRIGLIGFGGPPAHIALLRRLTVERHGWIDAQAFQDANAACSLLPGPASTQLAIFSAYRVGGVPGAIVGGLGFIVPAVVMILALSLLFLEHSPPLWVRGAGAGAGAAVAAVAADGRARARRSELRARARAPRAPRALGALRRRRRRQRGADRPLPRDRAARLRRARAGRRAAAAHARRPRRR